MKLSVYLGVFVACLVLAPAAGAAERVDQRLKRKERKEARKVRAKAVEAANIRKTFKDQQRLQPETEGKAGRVGDRKLTDERLEQNLAKEMREIFRLAKQKLGKKRNLLAETEAAERKARAEEKARLQQYRVRKKRKVDLTILFDL